MPSVLDVLGHIQARTLTWLSAGCGVVTIFVCYTIAVSLGHVPAWLPMISDCAVYAPEKYIFRFGMITTANLLFLNALMMFGFLSTITPGRRSGDKVGLVLAFISSVGLAIVGSVNEQENNPIHSGISSFKKISQLLYSNSVVFWFFSVCGVEQARLLCSFSCMRCT